MRYVHGASKAQPTRNLRSFEVQIIEARKHLMGLHRQIAEAKTEAAQARQVVVRSRARRGFTYRPMTPDEFQTEFQRSYDLAMRLHPENVFMGSRRLEEASAEATGRPWMAAA